MNTPQVSIIVPVYNVEKYLHQCLDSILAQTFTDWECLLVDDGSEDDSGMICDEYAGRDNRFVVVHKPNEGVAKARITAFEHSKAEWITFIDSDDYVSSDYLEKLLRPIWEQGADFVSCDYLMVENGIIREPRGKLSGIYEAEEIREFIAKHYFYDKTTNGYGMTCFLCTKMVRREYVAEGLKQGAGMWFGEDQVSMFSMLLRCHKLALIPNRLYHYILHEGQTVKRYDESLWRNVIALLSRYNTMLPDDLSRDGLRKRIWLYINNTIFKKMAPLGVDRSTFVEHISKMRNDAFICQFFKPWFVSGTKNTRIRYWILKLKMYNLFYYIFFLLKE